MSDDFTLLSDGLLQICENDPAADRLIAPRREAVFSLLVKYIAEIELHNPALSLVGTNDRKELIVRHILDSLAPLGIISGMGPSIARQFSIADVGSGAGLPGIPLAIAMPDVEFTLIERKGRRAGFLRNVKAALNISNVSVEEAEMEKIKPGRFSLVTFRAFKPLEPKMYKKLARLCVAGGCLAAYKGRREKIEEEMAALEKALPDIIGHWEYVPCPVPFLDEQRWLVIVKRSEL
ncbi:MAG: 16S rRNA (guanine(527)-N(7))-methyltransferase RsmG [Treponema sp.]|nr:16S rRNA (guanine(527)-N(7))-methyltransferase RsmG [Treponema sp.]